MDPKPEDSAEQNPERPLECSECRRPVSVRYTEIVGKSCTYTSMCYHCPQLERRLKGTHIEEGLSATGKAITGIVCGDCGTTPDNFLISRTVGCSNCYEVFATLILEEIVKSNKISQNVTKRKLSIPLHIGRAPGEALQVSPTLRLIALNETLEETLKSEDYEQAAWLRDQIKAITEGKEGNHVREE